MAAADIVFYSERLAKKEHELAEVQTAFNKYKLKQKVKLDQLKKDVAVYCSKGGLSINDKENCALLLICNAESEAALDESRRQVELLNQDLGRRQMQLNDHAILIKNLEEQIRSAAPLNQVQIEERKRMSQHIDIDRVQQQMMYKDERIVELNNIILDKERQILDLQETCREQGEVASVKNQAMRIVQKKFEDLEKSRREVGTETDAWLWPRGRVESALPRPAGRSLSPGHAIANRTPNNGGGSSPPPLDPSEAENRLAAARDDDEDLPGTSGFHGKNLDQESSLRKKQRKRVTFDLPPSASTSTIELNKVTADEQIANAVMALTVENAQLQRELMEQSDILTQCQQRLGENDSEVARVVREGKNASLKARAVAQARIRELEDRMAELNQQYSSETERLQTEVETLRSTREWEIEQNGKMREELAHLREKNHKLNDELDASEVARRELDTKAIEHQQLMDQLIEELSEAEQIVVFMEDQKHSILDDVDRLKDALSAQDELIEVLETDVVIYEEHVGMLRESLGASKVDHRTLIRSKAFETKLKAMEKEKEQINLKSHEDRLRTKALSHKVKVLEEENEKLMEKLCEKEMGVYDDADMAETCRQLEARIREADDRMQAERAEYELRVQTARLEAERKSAEANALLNELQQARMDLNRSNYGQASFGFGPNDYQQTQVAEPAQQVNTEELTRLRAEVDAQARSVEHLRALNVQLNEQIDSLRVTNFELHDQVQDMRQASEDFDTLVEKHRIVSATLVQLTEQKDQKEIEVFSELDAIRSVLAGVENEKAALRTELEHARLNLLETNAVKVELEQLRNELEHERASGKAKWDDVCRRLLDGESSENGGSRKNSMEVQQQQYIVAFEEKIEHLQNELTEAMQKIEEDKQEKRKLKAAVKKLRAEAAVAVVAPVQEEHVVGETPTQAAPPAEQAEEVQCAESQQPSAEQAVVEDVEERIKNLELECSLSGELNIELGRAMLELEGEVESYRNQIMELRLHEMLQEELGRELDEMKLSNAELQSQLEIQRDDLNSKVAQLEELQFTYDSQDKTAELARVSRELDETRETLVTAEIDHRSRSEAQAEEIRLLRHSLEESAQRVEQAYEAARHLEAELTTKTDTVEQLQAALILSNGELARRSSIVEEQALLQAMAATTEVVTNVRSEGQHINVQMEPVDEELITDETQVTSATPDLESENLLLRQCVNESVQMHDDMSQDVAKLLELKMELENAVDALKGEIWTLNGQLKASIIDRENLQDRVVSLDTTLATERRRADVLDVELAEQVELTEKATRQAAKAENQSNRRLAECLDMENRREELEKAYAQLTEYYNQLQAAYNVLYARVNSSSGTDAAETTENEVIQQSSTTSLDNDEVQRVVDSIMEELHLPLDEGMDLRAKLALIHTTMRTRMAEIEESRRAIHEQRHVNEALSNRLEALEEETQRSGGESQAARVRLGQLEGDLEWKQEECDSLQRRINELQRALDVVVERDDESEARRPGDLPITALATTRLRTELAILAAKLATRQADVDSLFRTNAELAHTNVRLQNELDEMAEQTDEPVEEMIERVVITTTETAVSSCGTDDNHARELEAEVARLRGVEQSLLQTINELEATSSSQVANEVEWGWGGQDEQTVQPNPEEQQSRIEELETQLQILQTNQNEMNRLSGIEKILNNRILSLEDQLLEKEEAMQEMEETLLERREEMTAKIGELEHLKRQLDEKATKNSQDMTARVQELEDSVNDAQGIIMDLTQELQQARMTSEEESKAVADTIDLQSQIDLLKEELEITNNKQEEGKATETWGAWNDGGRTVDDVTEELEKFKLLLLEAIEERNSLQHQLNEKQTVQQDKSESATIDENPNTNHPDTVEQAANEDWGWGEEEKPEQEDMLQLIKEENEMLRKEAELLENLHKDRTAKLEETIKQQEDVLELLRSQVDDLEEAMAEAAEEHRLLLEEREQELRLLRTQVQQIKEAAEQTAEKEEHKQPTADIWSDDTAWGDEWNDKPTEPSIAIEEERQMRIDAEELAESLKSMVAQQRNKISEMENDLTNSTRQDEMDRLISEVSRLTSDLAIAHEQLEQLRSESDNRAEAWGWEEQSSKNQLDAAREDELRLREELESAESERRRLTDEMFADKQKLDELTTEMQLIRANDSEAAQRQLELEKELEDSQIRLQALEAENDSLQSRVAEYETTTTALQHRISTLEASINDVEQLRQSSNEIESLQQLLDDCQNEFQAVQKRLVELEKQNNLLQESEARLLDSVDTHSFKLERSATENARINKENTDLKRILERVEADYLDLKTRLENLSEAKVTNHTETDDLRRQLAGAVARLATAEQEKAAVKASYEQLRSRLVARRQAQQASKEVSRRSSIATVDGDIPEEQTTRNIAPMEVPVHHVTVNNLVPLNQEHELEDLYREAVERLVQNVGRYLDVEQTKETALAITAASVDVMNDADVDNHSMAETANAEMENKTVLLRGVLDGELKRNADLETELSTLREVLRESRLVNEANSVQFVDDISANRAQWLEQIDQLNAQIDEMADAARRQHDIVAELSNELTIRNHMARRREEFLAHLTQLENRQRNVENRIGAIEISHDNISSTPIDSQDLDKESQHNVAITLLTTSLEHSESSRQQLQDQLRTLEEIYKQMKEDHANEISHLHGQLDQMETTPASQEELSILQQQLKEKSEELSRLTEVNIVDQETLIRQAAQNVELEQKMADLEITMTEDMESLKEILDRTRKQLATATETIRSLEQAQEKTNEQFHEFKLSATEREERLNEEMRNSTDRCVAVQQELDSTAERLSISNLELAKFQRTSQSQNVQLRETDERLSDFQELIQSKEHFQELIQSKEAEIETQRSELHSLQDEMKSSNETWMSKCSTLQLALEKKEEELGAITKNILEENASQKTSLEEARINVDLTMEAHLLLQQELKEKCKEMDSLRSAHTEEIDYLKYELSAKQGMLAAEVARLESQCSTLQKKLDKKEAELDELQRTAANEIGELRTALSDENVGALSKLATTEHHLSTLRTELIQKSDELDELRTSSSSEILDLNNNLAEMQNTIASLYCDLSTKQAELSASTSTQYEKENQLAHLHQQNANYEDEIARLECDIHKLTAELQLGQSHLTKEHAQQQSASEAKLLAEECATQLRQDNVRLERELSIAHERIQLAESELHERQVKIEANEQLVSAARSQSSRLHVEIDQLRLELDQASRSDEARLATNRCAELEGQISQMKKEHNKKTDQILSDLRTTQSRLNESEEIAESVRLQVESKTEQMESWRLRCEAAESELESQSRSIQEVHHLEAALHQSRSECDELSSNLLAAVDEATRLVTERDRAMGETETVRQQLAESNAKLQRLGEHKMESTLRFVEMESQLASMTREMDSIRSIDTNVAGDPSGGELLQEVRLNVDEGEPTVELEQLRQQIVAAHERIAELETQPSASDEIATLPFHVDDTVDDFTTSSSVLLRASAPVPSLVARIRRHIRILRRRPQRALLPYLRYAAVVYFIFVHIMLIHCWFM